jgi:hypothetical protein
VRRDKLIIYERGNTLTVQERVNGALVTVMRVTHGAVTEIQRQYFVANLKGRIKQVEADLILKYFYNINIE